MSAGRTLAGYLLEERIAVGGMAEIYRARRVGPGGFAKQVVVKTVLPELCRDPELRRMFLEEARIASRLSSPHLVQVFDAGEEDGTSFLVMEYVEGVDLAALLQEGALPPGLALHLGRQLCAGLGDLHEAADQEGRALQVVHRDVNPANVLLSTSGDVKLGDFGIAKARARGLRTERGTLKGKLAYLSPEQARGEEVDQRTDLYGVGLVLFECLTGERFLSAQAEADLLREAMQPRPRSPSSLRPELPAQLDAVVARALAPEPARRYPSARQLDHELALIQPGLDPARAREELAALVTRLRRRGLAGEPGRQPAAEAAERGAAATLPAPPAARPATEVLPVGQGRPKGRLLVLGLAGAALLLGGLSLAWLLPRPSGKAPLKSAELRSGPRPDAAVSVAAAPPPERSLGDAAPLSPALDLAAVRRSPPRRTPKKSAADAAAALAAPDQRGAGPAPEQQAQLGRITRLLEQQGLLPEDAPELFARRRALLAALPKGQVSAAELENLEASIRGVVIDRAFVEQKLQRLDRRMRTLALPEALRRQLQQHGQRALSYAVTGQYREANRVLNQIASILERR